MRWPWRCHRHSYGAQVLPMGYFHEVHGLYCEECNYFQPVYIWPKKGLPD
jgi:hypothetical protein